MWSVSALLTGAYTTTLLVMVDRVQGHAPPHPQHAGLILPS
jgi:hypothetical protein